MAPMQQVKWAALREFHFFFDASGALPLDACLQNLRILADFCDRHLPPIVKVLLQPVSRSSSEHPTSAALSDPTVNTEDCLYPLDSADLINSARSGDNYLGIYFHSLAGIGPTHHRLHVAALVGELFDAFEARLLFRPTYTVYQTYPLARLYRAGRYGRQAAVVQASSAASSHGEWETSLHFRNSVVLPGRPRRSGPGLYPLAF
ncbi:unnamed protein product [Protopolystoma xenopodis]|uniref:Uncharacterized protein n=1 Tax=Protopolystoma xenopodis TaxID=117903 RepID=A0A3S5CH09_9PLAT|nr:unnamed protein product [Protopolystoma xenopodis]